MHELADVLRRQLATGVRELPRRSRARLSAARRVERCANVADLRSAARRALPRAVFDFVDGAANDETTARDNERDFERVRLHARVLVGVEDVDASTTALGEPIAVPIIGGPTGLTGLVHADGELGVARAAHAIGSLYVLSAMSSYSIEELAAVPGPKWFQLYVWRDRGLVRDLIQRASAAGYGALVVTVDVPVAGQRERDWRNGFGIPPRLTARTLGESLARPRWSAAFVARPRIALANVAAALPDTDAVSLTEYINGQFDPTLSWDDLAWIRAHWSGPIVVKGIMRPDDALRAVDAGAAAVVVSNHGGRQLDAAPSTVSVLPAVAHAVGDRAEVYVDGGVRRGVDVLKALALGARACLVARPLVYGLAAGGEAGARRAADLLVAEVRVALALAGCRGVDEVSADLLGPIPTMAH